MKAVADHARLRQHFLRRVDEAVVQIGADLFNRLVTTTFWGISRTLTKNHNLERHVDQWANYANTERAVATTGHTRFVGPVGSDGNDGLNHTASKRTVLFAVNSSSAGGGDIVLIRPGNYNESLTLNKPVTLRATRAGSVTIDQ